MHKIHNNNGLARGSLYHPEDIVVLDSSGGVLIHAKRGLDPTDTSKQLMIIERIQVDSRLDNSYCYDNPYATPANNASGYILPGLAKAAEALNDMPYLKRPNPSCVRHVKSQGPKAFNGKNM